MILSNGKNLNLGYEISKMNQMKSEKNFCINIALKESYVMQNFRLDYLFIFHFPYPKE